MVQCAGPKILLCERGGEDGIEGRALKDLHRCKHNISSFDWLTECRSSSFPLGRHSQSMNPMISTAAYISASRDTYLHQGYFPNPRNTRLTLIFGTFGRALQLLKHEANHTILHPNCTISSCHLNIWKAQVTNVAPSLLQPLNVKEEKTAHSFPRQMKARSHRRRFFARELFNSSACPTFLARLNPLQRSLPHLTMKASFQYSNPSSLLTTRSYLRSRSSRPPQLQTICKSSEQPAFISDYTAKCKSFCIPHVRAGIYRLLQDTWLSLLQPLQPQRPPP
jgi:hypothetical protein